MRKGICSAGKCINTVGSYVCECGPGLQKGPDKNTCTGKYFSCNYYYMANMNFVLSFATFVCPQAQIIASFFTLPKRPSTYVGFIPSREY